MIAYVDESYEVGPAGVYVLAAVLCEEGDAEVRQAMLALREPWRRQWKLHFHDADAKRVPIYGGLTRRHFRQLNSCQRS